MQIYLLILSHTVHAIFHYCGSMQTAIFIIINIQAFLPDDRGHNNL